MFVPDLRLNAELAAARREGLWASPEDIARDQKPVLAELNAMTLIAPLAEAERTEIDMSDRLWEPMQNFVRGNATPSQAQIVKTWFQRRPELADEWREATRKTAFSSGTDWAKGFDRVWKGDELRLGIERLIVASILGRDPRENLIAAARLGALTRQEPGLISQGLGYRYLEPMLRRAKQLGIVREVNAAFGPPADFRLAYRGLMADEVAMMEEVRGPDYRNRKIGAKPTLEERFRQLAPFAAAAKQRVVLHWRQLWKDLPADPTDYTGAAEVLDRDYPLITAEIGEYSHPMDGMVGFHHSSFSSKPGDALRRIAELEAMRKKVL